jgi:tetratricopeptide (TPR) repeat protein
MKDLIWVLVAMTGLCLAGCATPTPAVDLLGRGERLYEDGQYDAAADAFGEVTQRYPGDWKAQLGLGRSLLALDRPVEAEVALEVARTRRPDDPDIADALAQSMFDQGKQAELLRFLRARAERTNASYDYLVLAAYYDAMNDPDSARSSIHKAIDLDRGRTADPYLAAADLAERLGDRELMMRRLRQAYGIAPWDQTINGRLVANGEVPGPTLALPPGR